MPKIQDNVMPNILLQTVLRMYYLFYMYCNYLVLHCGILIYTVFFLTYIMTMMWTKCLKISMTMKWSVFFIFFCLRGICSKTSGICSKSAACL